MSQEEVIAKVKKLLRLAHDKRANEHEAALAAEHAQRLLDEHKLSLLDVRETPIPEEKRTETEVKAESRVPSWRCTLIRGVTSTTYTYVLYTPGTGYSLFGKPTDIAVARELIDFLTRQVSRLADAYEPEQSGDYSARVLRGSFRDGCAGRVAARLREAFKARVDAVRTEAGRAAGESTSRALALVNEGALAEKYAQILYPKTRTRRSRGSFVSSAYEDGKRAGNSVRLTPTIGVTKAGDAKCSDARKPHQSRCCKTFERCLRDRLMLYLYSIQTQWGTRVESYEQEALELADRLKEGLAWPFDARTRS